MCSTLAELITGNEPDPFYNDNGEHVFQCQGLEGYADDALVSVIKKGTHRASRMRYGTAVKLAEMLEMYKKGELVVDEMEEGLTIPYSLTVLINTEMLSYNKQFPPTALGDTFDEVFEKCKKSHESTKGMTDKVFGPSRIEKDMNLMKQKGYTALIEGQEVPSTDRIGPYFKRKERYNTSYFNVVMQAHMELTVCYMSKEERNLAFGERMRKWLVG